MEKNNKPILEFFNNNPNTSYEIIFVLDIDYSEYPYYYKILIKDIKTNFYTTVLIPPELLRYRYKIGNIYKGNKIIGKNNIIKSSTFTIDTTNELQIQTLKDVISESDLHLVSYDYFKNFYLKQCCYLFEFDDFELIIPTYTYPKNFKSFMKKNRLTYWDMVKEIKYLSFWYDTLVNDIAPRYVAFGDMITKEEVESAKKYLKKKRSRFN